ncbi:MAG: 3-hydroxybutyryl-CoA dehydrogenase [Halioglobus sp.]|jgi:3-hydroxybutyryl-CoA dehydrogenase
MKISEIDTVCFVGAGTMGCFNSLMAAVAGYRAVIYDVSTLALDNVPASLVGMSGYLIDQGFFSRDDMPQAIARITTNPVLSDAVAEADLVSESVSERLEIKRDVHRTLDELCCGDTLITTNTSSLLVSDIEDVLVHGDRFAALHSHLGSILFDIVGGPRTSPKTIDILERYVKSVHGMPLILKKENPGYVLNAMIGPLLATAQLLVIDGLATHDDVDRAWMLNEGTSIGPFGLMDLFGLNIIFDSWQAPNPKRAHLQKKVIKFLTPFIEKNTLGVKTGAGFYRYPSPGYSQTDFLTTAVDLFSIYEALISALIESAIFLAHKQIAEPSEIDRAWMASFSLPRGPFGVLDEIGVDIFLELHASLVERGLFSAQFTAHVEAFLRPYVTKKLLGVKTGEGFYRYPEPEYRQDDFVISR